VKAWGKVRTELEKRIAQELVERFPDKFTTDFETNKKTRRIPYQHFINKAEKQIAGYITQLQNQKKQQKQKNSWKPDSNTSAQRPKT